MIDQDPEVGHGACAPGEGSAGFEDIAHPTHGMNQLLGEGVIHFPPQPPHRDIDDIVTISGVAQAAGSVRV